jgi:predicted enzyme related to lactoylglutathione lyase
MLAFVCTVAVSNVDETVAAAQRFGETVALPKTSIPSVGWLAYFKDSEGNLLGLMTNDPAAR